MSSVTLLPKPQTSGTWMAALPVPGGVRIAPPAPATYGFPAQARLA